MAVDTANRQLSSGLENPFWSMVMAGALYQKNASFAIGQARCSLTARYQRASHSEMVPDYYECQTPSSEYQWGATTDP